MIFGNEYYIVMMMRTFFYSFLVFLMLTPSLACAMPRCAGEEKAGTMVDGSHCAPDHMEHENQLDHDNKTVKLLIDCMGVDMQKAAMASLERSDIRDDASSYAPVDDLFTAQSVLVSANTIRGPPPGWLAFHEIQPSLILITQRFRI